MQSKSMFGTEGLRKTPQGEKVTTQLLKVAAAASRSSHPDGKLGLPPTLPLKAQTLCHPVSDCPDLNMQRTAIGLHHANLEYEPASASCKEARSSNDDGTGSC